MRPILSRFVTMAAFLLVIPLAGKAFAAPSITSLSPTSAAVGASVTITGTNFGSTKGSSTVKFNGTTATVQSWSASSIVATVPNGATSGNVVVTVSGAASNGRSFTVLATPTITSRSPTSGPVGVQVTITGSGFGSTRGSSTVTFNGTLTGTPSSWSATQIRVNVPAGATSGNIVVRASGVNSNGSPFTVLPTPAITSVSAPSGVIEDTITITGTNFGTTQGSSTIKFNGTAATPSSWSDTSIVTEIPAGATSGNIVVTVNGVNSAGASFIVFVTPTTTSLSPSSSAVGGLVTINGSGFQANQSIGSSTVTFNGVDATPTSWTNTQIKAPVPADATSRSVVVTVGGLSSNPRSFTVKPTPVITMASPMYGAVGVLVTITGANFGNTQGSSTVKFNGTTATPAGWSATRIVVPVPGGATTGNLVLRTSNVDVNAGAFTVTTITSLTIAPTNLTIPRNSVQRFQAIATNSNGTTQDIASSATWQSSDTAVGTIRAPGVVQAVPEAGGQTGVQVTFGAFTASTTMTFSGRAFMPVGSLLQARSNQTGTLLQDGRVLITGGGAFTVPNDSPRTIRTAEVYDPVTKTVSWTGSLTTPRQMHSATLLPNGQVLVVAGLVPHPYDASYTIESGTAELYDPATGQFVATGSLQTPRYFHEAQLLPNGQVLIVGGFRPDFGAVTTAEMPIPRRARSRRRPAPSPLDASPARPRSLVTAPSGSSEAPAPTPMDRSGASRWRRRIASIRRRACSRRTRVSRTASRLTARPCLPTARSWSPAARTAALGLPIRGSTTPDPDLHRYVESRREPAGAHATRLDDGTVLVLSGDAEGDAFITAELFDPATNSYTGAGSMSIGRSHQSAIKLTGGTVLIVGGSYHDGTIELYGGGLPTPASLQITPSTLNMTTGATAQFTARDDQDRPRPDATWTVNDPTVATLTFVGGVPTLSARNPGEVTLTADIEGVQGQAQVMVSPQSLRITPAQVTMLVGQQRQFSVVDERGIPSPIATWTVSNPALAEITGASSPMVTALAAGQFTLTATVNAVSMQVEVTVSAAASLPIGAVEWAVPTTTGFVPTGLVQAVPGGSETMPSSSPCRAASTTACP